MTESAREEGLVTGVVLIVSAVTWVMLTVNPGGILSLSHCPVTQSGASPASFRMLFEMNPPSSLAAGWALMLVAMMLPTLIAPIQHIVSRSFRHRRLQPITLFLAGYALLWMAAGAVLLAAELMLGVLAPKSYLPAAGVGLAAFVWQCSPIKQRCLNRNHNHTELRAFGWGAKLDALRFGVSHGFWCIGSCWALMLFPMLLPQGHTAAMAAMTFLMISERLDPPAPLSWRLRGPGKLIRILVAQTRIRWQSLRPNSTSPSAVV
ncbi:MAG TPA: DUF2182 domain-containing protein [Candidatus Limnocylindria bacterium]|jgi:predicted metal-binding membrane protein|nr:DUF2182 domain-containing protein [Candidatus Limnocylindria bacterium]